MFRFYHTYGLAAEIVYWHQQVDIHLERLGSHLFHFGWKLAVEVESILHLITVFAICSMHLRVCEFLTFFSTKRQILAWGNFH